MSNNVIYNGVPYHVVDVEGHEVELEPVGEGRSRTIRVDVMAPGLVIDPTDDQWAAARRATVSAEGGPRPDGDEERIRRPLAPLDRLEELRRQITRDYPPPNDGLTDVEWLEQERDRR